MKTTMKIIMKTTAKLNIKKLIPILISSFLAAILGFIIRYSFLMYENIDIIRPDINPASCFCFIFLINFIRLLIKNLLEEQFNQTITMGIGEELKSVRKNSWKSISKDDYKPLTMNINELLNPAPTSDRPNATPNPPSSFNSGVSPNNLQESNYQAGSSTSQEGWGDPNQPRANEKNGPIKVNDPRGQHFRYDPDGNNEPLLGNLAKALEHQRDVHGVKYLSRHMFSNEQADFMMQHLFYTDRSMYRRLLDTGNFTRSKYTGNIKWSNHKLNHVFIGRFKKK